MVLDTLQTSLHTANCTVHIAHSTLHSETVSKEDVPVKDLSQEEAAVGGGYENSLVLHTVSWPQE